MRWIDRIWHVRGSVPLAGTPGADAVFARLAPVFRERGTTTERDGDTLVFRKHNPDSQDRLASFEVGRLWIAADTPDVLHYDLTSHPLLWCFIAPLPFAGAALAIESMRIPGYSFAGIFAALYMAGRWIEQRQAGRLFVRQLSSLAATATADTTPVYTG